MIWVYDNAVVEDLKKSFNPNNVPNPVVSVIDPENAIGLAAQVQEDKIQFPIVALTRNDPVEIDEDLRNFTKTKKGVATTFDNEHNIIYSERSMPIKLSYELSVFATNTADMDEIIREILFKYSSMYFLTITIPYESKRRVRFGIVADIGNGIHINSTSSTYVAEGKLYGSSIRLNCEGCVLVHYTPRKLQRFATETIITDPTKGSIESVSYNSVNK